MTRTRTATPRGRAGTRARRWRLQVSLLVCLMVSLGLFAGCAPKSSGNLRPSMLNNPGGAQAFADTQDFEQQFSLGGAKAIVITNPHGPITIFAEDRTNIVCRGTKKVSASGYTRARDPGKSMAEARKATQKGIKKTRFTSRTTEIGLEISLESPEARDGVFGEVSRIFVDAAFSVPKGVSVFLDNNEGGILVDGIQGDVKILQRGMGLGATVRNVGGNVDISTSNGPLNVGRVAGNINLMCLSGTIRSQDIGGSGVARTRRGDILYLANEPPKGNLSLQTGRGDITAYLPVTSDAQIEAAAAKGEVSCKLPIRIVNNTRERFTGQMGSGSARFTLRTNEGNVELLNRTQFPELLDTNAEMSDEEFEKAFKEFKEFQDDGTGRPRWQQEDSGREIQITPGR